LKYGTSSSVTTTVTPNVTYTALYVNYTGSTNVPQGVYRVYTTKPSPGLNITNNGNNFYFQGGSLI